MPAVSESCPFQWPNIIANGNLIDLGSRQLRTSMPASYPVRRGVAVCLADGRRLDHRTAINRSIAAQLVLQAPWDPADGWLPAR